MLRQPLKEFEAIARTQLFTCFCCGFQLNPDHPLQINPPSPQHRQSLTSFEHLFLHFLEPLWGGVTCCPTCCTIAHQQYLQPEICADAPPNSKTAASFKSRSAVSEVLWVCDITYLSPESQQGLCKAGALLSEGFPGFRDIFLQACSWKFGLCPITAPWIRPSDASVLKQNETLT